MIVVDLEIVRVGVPSLAVAGPNGRAPYVRVPVLYRTEAGEEDAVVTMSLAFARGVLRDLGALLLDRSLR